MMNSPIAWFAIFLLSLTLPLRAQQARTGNDSPEAPAPPAAASNPRSEIEELKRMVLDQQRQIDELKRLVMQQAEAGSAPKPVQFVTAANVGAAPATPVAPVNPVVPAAISASSASQQGGEPASPLQIKIGDATITPVGFMDITNTFRSTNAGTSLQTNFGSIPYNNVAAGRLTENKLSAANSRLGLRVDAKFRDTNVMGYFEGDFVGGVAGNNTQVSSNSLLYRIRLYWIDL